MEEKSPISVTEVPHAGPSTQKSASREQARYLRRLAKESPYSRTQLAQIVEIEKDKDGNSTGRARVELLTMLGVRTSVLMPIFSSQFMFMGGLPPINTLVLIDWLPQGVAVIVAYYPVKYRELIKAGRIPDLEEGEILLQSELTENGIQRAGATIKLDKAGSVIVQDKDKKTTITMKSDGTVVLDASKLTFNGPSVEINATTKVTIISPEVNLAGESGKKLLNDAFISLFNAHTHTSAAPGSPTTPPLTPAGGPHTTSKTKAE